MAQSTLRLLWWSSEYSCGRKSFTNYGVVFQLESLLLHYIFWVTGMLFGAEKYWIAL